MKLSRLVKVPCRGQRQNIYSRPALSIQELEDQEIGDFERVQERCVTYLEAPKL